jgi:hypothetical protein
MILTVDPGLVTGWATWDAPYHKGFQSGMVEGRFKFYEWFYGLQRAHWEHDPTTAFSVVIEKFTVNLQTAKKSPQPDAMLITGHIEAICVRDGLSLGTQLPSQAMSFGTNEKLKLLGWYKPGPDHPNDAARHLLLWMVRHPPPGSALLRELADRLGMTLGTDAPPALVIP